MARTLFEKIWEAHVVAQPARQSPIIYIDLHLVHEVTSPQAFDGLRAAGRRVRQPLRTVATVDHNVPTEPRGTPITDLIAAKQIAALQANCKEFGIRLEDRFHSRAQGVGCRTEPNSAPIIRRRLPDRHARDNAPARPGSRRTRQRRSRNGST